MLEDNYEDIIGKASRGLNKKINSSDIEGAAKELSLNFKALKNIKEGKYKPKKFDYSKTYNGLRVVKISSPFMDGEVNAYIIIDEDKNCAIIDTAQAAEKIIGFVKKEKLNVKAVLKTHEHYDHVGGIEKISSPFMDGEVNAYIIIDEDKNCAIIDTAQAAEKIIGFVKKE